MRRHDRDRFQTALFAPADRREALFALYAFNYEIARVREAASEPMLGQIRLQWWREAIAAAYAGEPPRRHEVVQPLTKAIREYDLDRADLDRIIDARERDLDPESPPTLAALQDYAEGTSATVVSLALQTLGTSERAARIPARSVGIGYALAGLLRAMPYHARGGRNYIPADIADRAGLDPADYAGGRSTPALRTAVAEIAAAARRHLAAAREEKRAVPRAAVAAVLPAVIAEQYLKRLRRAGHDPFAPQLALPDPPQAWRLLAASLLRRY